MSFRLINKIEEKIKKKLQIKTGWGRNEVMRIVKDAINESVLETMYDKPTDKKPL